MYYITIDEIIDRAVGSHYIALYQRIPQAIMDNMSVENLDELFAQQSKAYGNIRTIEKCLDDNKYIIIENIHAIHAILKSRVKSNK